MKIEVHVLQNVAPSCLNRDDTNTPKSCEFGGVIRARVSSQSWKRAMRELFQAENSVPVGLRTKQLQSRLVEKLGTEFEAAKVTKFLEECYSKMDGKRKDETAVLLFVSEAEIDEISACLREGVDIKAAITRLQAVRQSADIALFGRMLAEKPDRNIDAACQVAHAISTHQVNLETDFYTAVDDLTVERDEVGAGMLGTQGYNSACFYRYSLIDTVQLKKNLGGDVALMEQTIEAYLKAFTLAIPGAKQNSHAAQNLPSFALFIARDSGTPLSLANAFARPIRSEDLIGASIHALARYHARMDRLYGLFGSATQALFHDREGDKPLDELAVKDAGGLEAAVQAIMTRVRS
jgi:CRISPR system Cascade subunit CasC